MNNVNFYDYFDDLVSITNKNNIILSCNNSYCDFLNKTKDSIIGKVESELLKFRQYDINNSNKKYSFEKVNLKNTDYYFKTIKKEENSDFIITIRKNITEEKKLSTLYEENKKILKQIAKDENLNTILEEIIISAEKMNQDMKCSILLLDKSENRLYSASAPSIPEFYTSKINGMKIGNNVGSCGAAASLKRRIIVEDIQTHENWQLAKNLASKANLHACWSQPIFSSKKEVLGTFAMYYSTPRKPCEFDLYIIEDRANLAGIAIEKFNNEVQLQEKLKKEQEQEKLLMHKTKQAMMGEMIENIAHQWRQPLSIISTSATGINLKRELDIKNEDLEKIALIAINENAQYLSKTIDNFRNYFKSENAIHKFFLDKTLLNTLGLIDVLIKNKFVKVTTNIEKNIELTNLENELVQVFMNILNNAIDELENKSVEDRVIYIDVYKENDFAVVKINDSAGGASADIKDRIFEPYFTTKHQKQGTGIGLYMCKEMIEKHMKGIIQAKNNSFKINNKIYKGLEFTIKLPFNY